MNAPSARTAAELDLSLARVDAVVKLLDEGSTVPFIARYRKEATGNADDETVARISERIAFHRELDERRDAILKSIDEQGKLTDEIRAKIEAATTKTELEDLYLPYRPKRRTRATIAKERGLEPLADRMWAQADESGDTLRIAGDFVDTEKGVPTADDALQGARDIVAERATETVVLREMIRRLTRDQGTVRVKAARGKKDEKSKFSDYYDYEERVARIAPHRIHAILRGEKESFLHVRVTADSDRAKQLLFDRVVGRRRSIWRDHVRTALADAYDRLLGPQIETEVRVELRLRADDKAIAVFASNLEDLLMAPPFGGKPVLAIDPGLRTGCKVVILGATGALREDGLVHPTAPRKDVEGTKRALDRWYAKHDDVAAIAIGNGTGGRETFDVVQNHVRERGWGLPVVLVNESGASVYSASEIAREELPDHDVTVRGAVSIGRRLQDPLAELVKIDPRSIGVGQYQHDVDSKRLAHALEDVVERCVNQVGVDVNTASPALLGYVSGLNARLARNIVAFRDQAGSIRRRADLKKVKGLGAKTFEQAAGFLRVRGGDPLDDSAVHPERYDLVKTIARDLGRDMAELVGDTAAVRRIDPQRYVNGDVGLYTLQDILTELEKPGRDPRDRFEAVGFRDDVHELEDLRVDMVLPGVVTNVTHFGAFVDVGVHQDGLVHVSQIADRFVQDPSDELHVGQAVRVRVLDVDRERRRISLTIKGV